MFTLIVTLLRLDKVVTSPNEGPKHQGNAFANMGARGIEFKMGRDAGPYLKNWRCEWKPEPARRDKD